VATIVFIGGSLVEHGGQNPIEPAYFGRPVMFGRYMFNFKYIAGVLLKNKAAMQVFSMEDMYEKSKLLLSDPDTRNLLARRARDVIDSNKGATDRNIKCMQRVIG
jgi:3-deoxy-D-manno-octulosonic-acid transferase